MISRSRLLPLIATALMLALSAAPARAGRPRSPETEWQIGIVALAAIGMLGSGAMMFANVRRRREAFEVERDAYEQAARAQAAAIAPVAPAANDTVAEPDGLRPAPDRAEPGLQNSPGKSRQRT